MKSQLKSSWLIIVLIILTSVLITLWWAEQSPAKTGEVRINIEIASTSKLSDAYVEKILNFSLQEFDKNHKLSHWVKAKEYFNFGDKPALLIKPIVITYDLAGGQLYILSAHQAQYTQQGEIKFQGEVSIRTHEGVQHNINTQALLVGVKRNKLFTQEPVLYLSQYGEIASQGMKMDAKTKQTLLAGKVSIKQNRKQVIHTKNLHIKQINGQKYYHSSHETAYMSVNNRVSADQGVDINMQQEKVKLLGKVKIIQDTGEVIDTANLEIDQANGVDIYRTREPIHYQSKISDIRAIGMVLDTKRNKIKLTGGVSARYE
jgi:LPS export ABC transporter protein LptC